MCDTGFDGGLQQTFHMEVLSLAENIMYANRSGLHYYIILDITIIFTLLFILLLRSRDVPSFWASHLPAGEKVGIHMYCTCITYNITQCCAIPVSITYRVLLTTHAAQYRSTSACTPATPRAAPPQSSSRQRPASPPG